MTKFSIFILAFLILGLAIYSPHILRLYKLANLYNEKTIAQNFINIDKIFKNTSSPIPASDDPYIFDKKEFNLPEQYTFEGEELSLSDGLDHFHTDGLIVLHNGNMLYENYWNGNSKDSKHISFSVAKSYLSALIGIAVEEGLIDNIDDKVSKYLDDFKNTGYEKVTIKNLLQMLSLIHI